MKKINRDYRFAQSFCPYTLAPLPFNLCIHTHILIHYRLLTAALKGKNHLFRFTHCYIYVVLFFGNLLLGLNAHTSIVFDYIVLIFNKSKYKAK